MTAPVKLELRQVRKTFSGATAVDDLSLSLAQGEFVSLLGPSGCGKSTTLAMVAGFEQPDAGDILIDGKRVNDVPVRRRDVGIVFQDYAVFSRLSVRANLAFGLEARGASRTERQRSVAEMAERLELTPLLDARAGGLNMSEMQRLAIGRALITRPALLLLDEPMSNLDAGLRATLRAEIKRIQKALDQTVLYVTHDQIEAMAMSDRIVVMDRGRLLEAGTPDAIYGAPGSRFVAEFVGDPAINTLPARVEADAAGSVARLPAGLAVALGEAGPSPGSYSLCVRPQDWQASREASAGSVPAPVRFVDNLGAEHVLHVMFGDALVRVVVPPGFATAGETIHLAINAARCHFFDLDTGRASDRAPRRQAA